MNLQNNFTLNPLAIPKGGAPVYTQQPLGRIPQDFKEAMLHIPVKLANHTHNSLSDMAAKTQPAQKRAVTRSEDKWRSSFKPLGQQEDSLDKNTDSPQRVEMYDPYDPLSSDSEHEMLQNDNKSPHDEDCDLGRQCSSPSSGFRKKRRWGSCYSESVSHPLDKCDFSPETRPTQSEGLSPGHRLPEQQAYSLNTESLDQTGYDSISSPLDHRVCSPDRLIHASSAQQFPACYGGERIDGEERIIIPEYEREMNTAVRLSPPRLQQDYQQLKYLGTGQDQDSPSTEDSRNGNMNIIMDKRPISCDFCEVELANGGELEDHLESKSHWDTLEHIQQQNNYDDLVIAFLQEVMQYKSHQCSRAIEDGSLQALEENDHMTKIEMFHCAACSAFVSTSASSVHTHIASQEHLTNIKEFQVQQRRSCLDKAETMMKELKPQFEHFLKGGSPFE
ncbi:uncharacterized protein LOC116387810 isoform X2 [Anarrhichthys ocellatus]|uniref:uncharacterized protein LOC116387810 isoform X2 n=1 Tax=Anarrhichthys ocellatus TaxID=433405 RepID=UPI0012EDA1AF|nr:DBIRD complex subunit ZNF326 isoform X2 [Anarrhichthys ocellatus]